MSRDRCVWGSGLGVNTWVHLDGQSQTVLAILIWSDISLHDVVPFICKTSNGLGSGPVRVMRKDGKDLKNSSLGSIYCPAELLLKAICAPLFILFS